MNVKILFEFMKYATVNKTFESLKVFNEFVKMYPTSYRSILSRRTG